MSQGDLLMNFPIAIPSFVTASILFSIGLVIYSRVIIKKRIENFNTMFFKIPILIFFIIDGFNYFYAVSVSGQKIIDFPYYEKLQFKQRVSYTRCLISLGPFSRIACPKLFDGIESLLVPTKENLKERLKKCQLDKINWEPKDGGEIEYSKICYNAIKEVDRDGSHEEKLSLFNKIVQNIERYPSCSDRYNRASVLFMLNSLNHANGKYRVEECLKNRCYSFCGALVEYKSSLKSTQDIRNEFVIFQGKKYYAETYIKNLLATILFKHSVDRPVDLSLKRIGYNSYLYAYYKNGKLDHLISLIKNSLAIEIPEESKVFDINILRDVEEIKKHVRL